MINAPTMMMTKEVHGISTANALAAAAALGMSDINDLEMLLERFLVSIIAMAGAKAGAVRVLTDDGQKMRLVSQLGLPDHVVAAERHVERGCGMCGVASAQDTLIWMDDMGPCAQHSQQSYFGVQCQRVLVISLPHGPEILGIYNLFFEDSVHLASETETGPGLAQCPTGTGTTARHGDARAAGNGWRDSRCYCADPGLREDALAAFERRHAGA